MITGKQRSYLKGLANGLDPLYQLGKGGISENFIIQLDEGLEKRELIKVNILQNCSLDSRETAIKLADELDAEYVQSVGNRFVLYRESKDNKKIELPR